jgi:aspartyl-tRNA(Asn)/glutamyl-tRNA(Gln) amidotransferase subunit A
MTSVLTIAGARAALAARQISATELAEDRMSKVQDCPSKPFASVEWDSARARARAVDAALASRRPVGPLAGVPMAHKDMFDRASHVTKFGAKPGSGRMADVTAPVLERLDAAGQVDLGRLKMSEFALGPTGHNAHHPMPLNPTVPGAITGGSSSGSGVAVAAGLVAAALGSDTGGSIRLPAACCGIVGFKPTQGRVPLSHAMPLSPTQDCIGPLAHTVADARLMLKLIGGAHPADATCRDAEWPFDPPSSPRDLAGLVIGFDSGRFLRGLIPDTMDALNAARRFTEQQGGKVRDVNLAFFDNLAEPASVIAMCEAAAIHANRLNTSADSYGPQVRARLTQAAAVPATAYLRALQIRSEAIRLIHEEVFAEVDVLILPTLPGTPPMDATSDLADSPNFIDLINEMTRLTRPASILGLPALSLPVLRTGAGPISLQIIARHWNDALVARVAEAFETLFAPGLVAGLVAGLAPAISMTTPQETDPLYSPERVEI